MTNRLVGPVRGTADAETQRQDFDQRAGNRTRTVCRVVKVESAQDAGLARLQNISDGGMMLHLGPPMYLGDAVTVHLSDDTSVAAKVVWTEGETCGVQFTHSIDSAALLVEMAEATRNGSMRPVRLPTDTSGVAYSEKGIRSVRVMDVSQRGMKVQHQSGFVDGLLVKILLASGVEHRGVVRWTKGDIAGIQLREPVSLGQLGSSKRV